MAKQCKLSRREFASLVECTLSHAGYLERLREQGVVEPPAEEDS